MIAWYLLSAGILLIIIGAFLDHLQRLGSGKLHIDPKMSDREIKRRMKKSQRISVGSVMIMVGVLAVLISLGWRLVRVVMSYASTAR
jgi:hypothetical protein